MIQLKLSQQHPIRSWKRFRRVLMIGVGGSLGITIATGSAIALDLGGVQNTVNQVGGDLGAAGVPVQGTVNQINGTLSEINQYLQQLQSLYSLIASGNLRGLLGSLDGVLGELGLPDPEATQDAVWSERVGDMPGSTTTASGSNPTSSGSIRDLGSITQSVNRGIAQAITASVLSKAGQEKLMAQQSAIAQYIQRSGQMATEAQSKTVTQDVLKSVSQQQAISAQLEGHLSTQLTQLEIGQAATNLQLGSIDSGVGQLNQTQQSEQARQAAVLGQAGSMVYIPGLYATTP
ncbi:hypothetical protein NIES2135_67370 (plasmid) [Leptolyngbya boryana NIES-2135]|jgi:hypothetical protein|uniref:Uncharacterized protein n=1 Tax=Leptolyngbya boryana NIES-2135 TaxID=1973484 RepID=A0A1Z4JT47_LEPBY|nr:MULTISPECIES: hypothetical protein [Leptolyngbya]BAY59860.1 hypothetical protein NIES2135_67370 [Leptolyngbya boryana NIES-2135]MBD2369589.1 hypothetical protein [Leptolyngbya sp. FACHB-161]MBD2375966.1 hypothetical protein [Leptolyngbya sp. FACHB-238]MBD2400242.1 hypothetical protein [Leptolyngbya sp. FACHB-239]MBD2406783.1 hypothetical protein [Leptolyngbya sp. FACHB-402]